MEEVFFFLSVSPLSLARPPVTPNTAWHSAEDTPGCRLKEVKLMWELKLWGSGGEWLTQFLMESRHGWLTLLFSISPSPSPARLPGSPPRPTSPILPGLIVLHLFIQVFMAASSSCKPISPPDDGFLPQLSRLFIISADPHHISLTLGRWFSHWAALLTRHITNPLMGRAQTHTDTHREETSHHYITLQIYKVLKCYVEF